MSHIWQGCDSGEAALCVAYNHQAYGQIIVHKHQSTEFTKDLNIKVDGADVLLLLLGFYLFFFISRFIRQFKALRRQL